MVKVNLLRASRCRRSGGVEMEVLFMTGAMIALVTATMAVGLSSTMVPGVVVAPAPEKPFEQFQHEDATCRNWAQARSGGGANLEENMAIGAIAGTAVGAGLGAAIGSASGNAGAGAAIGAAGGLITGLAAGAGAAQSEDIRLQRAYDASYLQCMASYGHQLADMAPGPAVVVVPPAIDVPSVPVYPPPAFSFAAPPPFVYAPFLGMYVAMGIPQKLFYTGSGYICRHNDRWFRSATLYGPWEYLPHHLQPPVFSRVGMRQIVAYRDEQYRRYRGNRTPYRVVVYRPDLHSERRLYEHRLPEPHHDGLHASAPSRPEPRTVPPPVPAPDLRGRSVPPPPRSSSPVPVPPPRTVPVLSSRPHSEAEVSRPGVGVVPHGGAPAVEQKQEGDRMRGAIR